MSARDDAQFPALIATAFATLLVCAFFFVAVVCASPMRAYADDVSTLKERAATLESGLAALEAERDALEVELADIASSLEEIERTAEAYRDSESAFRRSGFDSVVALYKMENSPFLLLDSLLDAGSLSDALQRIDYFEVMRSKCVRNIKEIKAALEALEARKSELTDRQATVQSDLEDKSAQIEQTQAELEAVRKELASGPGRRIAAAAVALAGCQTKSNKAPGPASYYGKTAHTTENARIAPPRKCAEGDWSVYLDVYSRISNGHNVPNHACCDCFPVLAVLWSGVDDGYLEGKYPDTNSEYNYLTKSPKWNRVGGDDGYWYRNPPAGANQVELQPGDILMYNNPAKDARHWMVYVGHDVAANRWGESTVVDCVDEGYRTRWTNGKPLSSRKQDKWVVFRRNTVDYDPYASRWADFMKGEKERYL